MTPDTLWQRWCSNAETSPNAEAVVWWKAGEAPRRWARAKLLRSAAANAAEARKLGIRPGDVCALVLRHHAQFYPLYMGLVAAGAVPAVLAWPNPRLHPDKFREGLIGMSRHSGLDCLLTERELEPIVAPLAISGTSSIRAIFYPLEWRISPSGDNPIHDHRLPTDACLLQHSSGTTGLQKGVVLSHRAVLDHVERYGRTIRIGAGDRVVSWLPLYHDMGLIAAFHLPLALGIPTVHLDPFEWIAAPAMLLEVLTQERGTLCWLPNFAYNVMADRVHDDELTDVNLEKVRLFVNCSEPVRQDSHERFARRFADFRLRRHALGACYAMAETTFAVTQTPPGMEAPWIDASRDHLAKGSFRPPLAGECARRCVSSGLPLPGTEIRIVGANDEFLPEGAVGEIEIRSPSLFDGYANQPEASAAALCDGWYRSGDLGFRLGEEYYIVGRKKDLIIVAGKNIYPEDIEDTVGAVRGIRPGRVVAFGVADDVLGTERVAVVAETDQPPQTWPQLRRAVVIAAMAVDVTVDRVYLAPPRWLVKSSSGKPARSTNRDRALRELSAESNHDQRPTQGRAAADPEA